MYKFKLRNISKTNKQILNTSKTNKQILNTRNYALLSVFSLASLTSAGPDNGPILNKIEKTNQSIELLAASIINQNIDYAVSVYKEYRIQAITRMKEKCGITECFRDSKVERINKLADEYNSFFRSRITNIEVLNTLIITDKDTNDIIKNHFRSDN